MTALSPGTLAAVLISFAACSQGGLTPSESSPPPAVTPGGNQGPSSGDWSTYVSEEIGFAFDYPSSLSPVEDQEEEEEEGEGALRLKVRLLGPEKDDPLLRDRALGEFGVEVFRNPRRLSEREWLDAHGWPFGSPGEGASRAMVGGLEALEVSTGRMLAPNRFLYLSAGDRMFRFTPLGSSSDRILESFRLR